MLDLILQTRRPRRALTVLCVTGLLGCAHVNPDELDSRLADLRAGG